jgi:hypothetical protein
MPAFIALWAAAHLALALGYCAAGLWPWTPLIFASAAAWIAARRRAPGACLLLSAAAAAAGALLSAPAVAMIAGAAAALGAWDCSTAGLPDSRDAAAKAAFRRYARCRLPVALGSIGAGAAVAAALSGIRLPLPFWGAAACLVVLAVSLDRAARLASGRGRDRAALRGKDRAAGRGQNRAARSGFSS